MKEVIQKNEKGRYKNWRREFTKTEMEEGESTSEEDKRRTGIKIGNLGRERMGT